MNVSEGMAITPKNDIIAIPSLFITEFSTIPKAKQPLQNKSSVLRHLQWL